MVEQPRMLVILTNSGPSFPLSFLFLLSLFIPGGQSHTPASTTDSPQPIRLTVPALKQTPAVNIILKEPVDTGWARFALIIQSINVFSLESRILCPCNHLHLSLQSQNSYCVTKFLTWLSSSHPSCSIADSKIRKTRPCIDWRTIPLIFFSLETSSNIKIKLHPSV